MAVRGTWNPFGINLPDFGFTELLREVAGKQPSAQATTTFNNPLIYANTPRYAATPQVLGAADTRTPSGTGSLGGTYPSNIQGRLPSGGAGVLGATTAAPAMDNGERLARMRYDADLANAENIRGQGQNTFNTLINAIKAFRDRAGTQFNNAGQEIVNTAAETLGGNARTAAELGGQARARGRAIGLGDSSKFNLQNKVDANLASTQGNVLARRGENERANRGVYDERLSQADTQESEANNYLKGITDFVANLRNQGAATYGGNLDNVLQYQRSLAALNPLNAGGLTQMAPNFAGIQNTLNGILPAGGPTAAGGDVAGNLAIPTDYLSLLRKRGLVN